MTKALRKNIIKCITGSLGRFFAIFMIIFIGVAFYSGLKLTKPVMIATLKEQLDKDIFYNLRLISTIGFNDDEVNAIKNIDGVNSVEGSYSMDFLATNDELTQTFRAHLITEDINRITLVSGRLPEKSNECVVDSYNFSKDSIGKTLKLSEKNDTDTLDFFVHDEYVITGLVKSPFYMSFEYGTTSLGNGTLDTFAYFPKDAFDSEYYTEIYLTFDEDLPLYSDEYDDLSDKMEDVLDKEVTLLLNQRYNDLLADAEEELKDGQETLNEKEADGKKELSDAKTELDDALKSLNEAKETIADGKDELDDARTKLDDARTKLDDAANQLSAGSSSWLAAIDEAEVTYADGLKTIEEAKNEAASKITEARYQLTASETLYNKSLSEYNIGVSQYDEGVRQVQEGYTSYYEGLTTYNNGLMQYKQGLSIYNENLKKFKAGEAEYEKGLAEYESGKAKYEAGLAQYEAGYAELTKSEAELNEASLQLEQFKPFISEEEYNAKKGELLAGAEILNKKKLELSAAKEILDKTDEQLKNAKIELDNAAIALSSSKPELDKGKHELEESEKQLAESKEVLDKSKEKLDNSDSELVKAKADLDNARIQLQEFREKLDDGKLEIEENEIKIQQELRDAEDKLSLLRSGIDSFKSGVDSYNSGLEDFYEGLAEYEDGLTKYEDGKKEYEDGKKEYNDGKKEFDEKIADAKNDIADAEEKLEDARSKDVKLYILDRMTTIAYNSFMTDSIIVEKISAVFPVFFFLVAALVCSTTMSRMVDDERTQIGTLRALGYSRRSIVSKYLIYSGSAAAAGCLAGYFAGGYIFPKVIWICYQMRYRISGFVSVYTAGLFLVGLATSLLCSMGIAFLSCLSEMRSEPADLIRPKSPASGKRILLERITPLWNSLSFLIKVSLRNVFRFKKRMIMMILGIAGCTALVITGFGIKDSVANIVNFQYDDIHTYDIVANFDNVTNEALRDSVISSFKKDIDNAYIIYQTSLTIKSHNFSKTANLIVSDNESITDVIRLTDKKSGQSITFPDKGNVIITNKLAEITNTKVGDTITLSVSDTENADFTVSAIADNYVNNFVYLSKESFEEGFGTYEPKTLLISTLEDTDNFQLAADIENDNEIASIQVIEQTRNTISSIMTSLDYVVILVIASAAALAFVVLFNLGNINISERVREIATIKVLGFHRNETSGYVFRENFLLTLMGIIAGIPLGIIFHRFVISQINVEVLSFKVIIKPVSFVFSAAMVILFFFVTNLILGRKLSEIDMAESLKSIE